MPARPGKPRDKAKVENAVLIAQRWIVARLRDEVFHSLAELNARVAALLEDLNTRPMKKCNRPVNCVVTEGRPRTTRGPRRIDVAALIAVELSIPPRGPYEAPRETSTSQPR
jgi:hypothetical protein